ncbi:MAG TPA: FAD-binding oxidoreductase [Micromonosporaceae bacterium]
MTAVDDLTRALGAAAVRTAGPADAVAGVQPRWVAAPTDIAMLSTLLATAHERELTVVPRGEGTKLHWGHAPRSVDVVVDMAGLTGIHQHYVDDLVATIGAGTPVRAVQAVLARTGQRLAADPGSADATIGGMLATGEAGPLRLRYGAPRDLLLGTEFVRADGTIAHSGGRVVKNVAGYDLGKLLAGSWGTLAVIASVTMRLQPLPAARAWVTRSVRTPLEVHDVAGGILGSGVDPSAIEVDLPSQGGGAVSVLLEGSVDGVARRAAEATAMVGGDAATTGTAPTWWGTYPIGAVALKMAVPVADLYAAIYALSDAVGTAVPVRGSAGAGVCYAAVPAERATAALGALRTTLIARGGSCVVMSAPPELHDRLDIWGPVGGLDLMHSVKARFDPSGVFAPGRFVGGI